MQLPGWMRPAVSRREGLPAAARALGVGVYEHKLRPAAAADKDNKATQTGTRRQLTASNCYLYPQHDERHRICAALCVPQLQLHAHSSLTTQHSTTTTHLSGSSR